MADELALYCESGDAVTMEELCENFSTPEEVAENFLTEMGAGRLSNAAVRGGQLVFVVSAVLLMAVIGLLGILLYESRTQIKLLEETRAEAALEDATAPYTPSEYIDAYYMRSSHGGQYWEYNRKTNTWENKPKPEGVYLDLMSTATLVYAGHGAIIRWQYNSKENSWHMEDVLNPQFTAVATAPPETTDSTEPSHETDAKP